MSAIDQYIELYKEHRDLIDSNSASAINDLRDKALEALTKTKLPSKGSENYETTDLDGMLSPDFGLNLNRVPIDVNPMASFRCDVPTLSSSLFMLLNDSWAATTKAYTDLPEGVTCMSLRKAADAFPDLVKSYYGKIADLSNPLVALNTLLTQDGLLLHVAKGVKLEKPLQLVSILNNGAPLMAVRRLLIIIDEGAEAKFLVCDHTQKSDIDFLSLQTVEIFVGANADFDLYDLEESTERTSRLNSVYLSQERDSRALINSMTLFNGSTRNEFYCKYQGKNAQLHLMGFATEDRKRHIDIFTDIRHDIGYCHTDELFKCVADDEATAAFTGKIFVAEGAEKTVAYQSNKNIVGSPEARMYSKPQLEIYNDDVKCSHGTAIGQLDATQLFYMRTRGLSEATAKLLLKQAFMADVIDGIRLPVLRDRIKLLLERRFAGEESSCSSCMSDCSSLKN